MFVEKEIHIENGLNLSSKLALFVFSSRKGTMNGDLLRAFVWTVLICITSIGGAQSPKHCIDQEPPSIWILKSAYPFQAGSERTFDELYHGPWMARVDIVLYAGPRVQRVVGKLKQGTQVEALIGESIVVHPLRLIAAQDFRVEKGLAGDKAQLATVRKGDVFWVLNAVDEGEFTIWWRCNTFGWDSTEPSDVDQSRLESLGSNEERWVKVRDQKTGLSGWFKDVPIQGGPKLVPAQATTKSTG
jgi:hypothetical protein